MAQEAKVKLVADISPGLKADLDEKARASGISKREAVERALRAWLYGYPRKGKA